MRGILASVVSEVSLSLARARVMNRSARKGGQNEYPLGVSFPPILPLQLSPVSTLSNALSNALKHPNALQYPLMQRCMALSPLISSYLLFYGMLLGTLKGL